jgi:hypothetical protein
MSLPSDLPAVVSRRRLCERGTDTITKLRYAEDARVVVDVYKTIIQELAVKLTAIQLDYQKRIDVYPYIWGAHLDKQVSSSAYAEKLSVVVEAIPYDLSDPLCFTTYQDYHWLRNPLHRLGHPATFEQGLAQLGKVGHKTIPAPHSLMTGYFGSVMAERELQSKTNFLERLYRETFVQLITLLCMAKKPMVLCLNHVVQDFINSHNHGPHDFLRYITLAAFSSTPLFWNGKEINAAMPSFGPSEYCHAQSPAGFKDRDLINFTQDNRSPMMGGYGMHRGRVFESQDRHTMPIIPPNSTQFPEFPPMTYTKPERLPTHKDILDLLKGDI